MVPFVAEFLRSFWAGGSNSILRGLQTSEKRRCFRVGLFAKNYLNMLRMILTFSTQPHIRKALV